MNSELETISEDKVLFGGVLFTRDAVNLQGVAYEEAKKAGVGNVWQVVDQTEDRKYNSEGLLFLSTMSGNEKYRNQIVETRGFRERLMIMKGALIDERIPSSVIEHGCDEYEYDDGNADIYPWERHYGRDWILDQVKKHHFTAALPEVRKIISDGLCPYLKGKAIETIVSLGGREAAYTLSQKLVDEDDFMIVREAAATGLGAFHYSGSVPFLREAFEKTIHISPWDLYDAEKESFGGGSREQDFSPYAYEVNKKIRNDDWLPMICLDSLSSVPSEESLKVLEGATRLHVEQSADHARHSISKWIDTNLKFLGFQFQRNGKLSDWSIARTNLLKRLVYDYDLTPKKDVYDTPFGRYTFRK